MGPGEKEVHEGLRAELGKRFSAYDVRVLGCVATFHATVD